MRAVDSIKTVNLSHATLLKDLTLEPAEHMRCIVGPSIEYLDLKGITGGPAFCQVMPIPDARQNVLAWLCKPELC